MILNKCYSLNITGIFFRLYTVQTQVCTLRSTVEYVRRSNVHFKVSFVNCKLNTVHLAFRVKQLIGVKFHLPS